MNQGVNLGGWLIVEKWLTPSVFSGIDADDEWGLSQTPQGRRRIRTHRKTFITEADFRWLQQHKVNFIRLPVPYWAIVETKDYIFAQKEVDWAMAMAEKYDINVLLDMHAAQGGQNNDDHSGKAGEMEWFVGKNGQNHTIDMLLRLAKRYGSSPALWGIELLNEPHAKRHAWQLVRFYRRAYRQLRRVLRLGTRIVFHDGFRPHLFTGALWSRRTHPVLMDVHWYGFELPLKKSTAYIAWSYRIRKTALWVLSLWQPIIVGEWSGVMPQRFFDALPAKQHEKLLKQNIAMQQRAYTRAEVAYYWNYKAEGDGMWNFRWLKEHEFFE